jgi:hypothetical protein
MDTEDLVSTWRQIIADGRASWVLFAHGTCVVLPEPRSAEELGAQAVSLLGEYGPVRIGSSSGDFDVIHLEDVPGWCVTCHHGDVLTYVEPTDVTRGAGDLEVGLCGRSKRHMDGTELTIAHVEDNRAEGSCAVPAHASGAPQRSASASTPSVRQ